MESSQRNQLSPSWRWRMLPGVVLLLACILVVASKGVSDKDAAKPPRRPGSSERRLKSLNATSQGGTDDPAPMSPSRSAPQGSSSADDASSSSSSGSSSLISSSSSSSSAEGAANASLKRHRLIHGSKNAVTITKKEYLKKDWCETEPFQQVVEEEGCVQKRITNRFCYGQCNSFFIPKTDKEDADASSFRSCAYCAPKVAEWVTIVLRCPSRTPPFKRKRVQIVKQCKCMAVKLD